IANNMLLGISMIGVAEAMSLGTNLGMDPHTLAEVINHSSGRCWSSDTNNPVPGICPNAPASREYQGGFASGLMQKDLRLALQAAQKLSNQFLWAHWLNKYTNTSISNKTQKWTSRRLYGFMGRRRSGWGDFCETQIPTKK